MPLVLYIFYISSCNTACIIEILYVNLRKAACQSLTLFLQLQKMKADLEEQGRKEDSPITESGKTITGNDLSYRLPKPGHMKRSEENRVYVTVTYAKMTYAKQDSTARSINRLKAAAIPSLIQCVETRFMSFHDDPDTMCRDEIHVIP